MAENGFDALHCGGVLCAAFEEIHECQNATSASGAIPGEIKLLDIGG